MPSTLINIRVDDEDLKAWRARANETGGNLSQFIKNAVHKAISGHDDTTMLNLENENRKLDILVNSQREVIDLLNRMVESRAIQAEIGARMTAIASLDVDQGTVDRVMDAVREHGPVSIKQTAEHTGLSEVKVMEGLQLLEADGRVKRNFMQRPNTFEVA